jgi:hypothetical protein
VWLDHLLLGRPPEINLIQNITVKIQISLVVRGNRSRSAFKLLASSVNGLLAQLVRAHP